MSTQDTRPVAVVTGGTRGIGLAIVQDLAPTHHVVVGGRSQEGVQRVVAGLPDPARVRMACFDWDPFAALLPQMIAMARQDVDGMLARLFALIDGEDAPGTGRAEIPCILECAPHPLAARQDEAGQRRPAGGGGGSAREGKPPPAG